MIYDIKNRSLLAHIWNWYELEDIIDTIVTIKPKVFIWDASSEWEVNGGFNNSELLELNKVIERNNIKAYLLLGSVSEEGYKDLPSRLLPSFTLRFYPLYFLGVAHKSIGYKNEITVPTKLFYSHINRPHKHRCIMVDKLVEHELNNIGKFTWNILQEEYEQSVNYRFEYWTEEKIIANDDFTTQWNNSYFRPESEYFESTYDLVIESTTESCFLTEKTFKPILIGKPFIIFGAQHSHRFLKQLGFKLYDSIIDYSFDSIEDTYDRAEALCKELKRLNTILYSEQLSTLKKDIEYNRQLAIQLSSDRSNYPLQFVEKYVTNIWNYRYL